MIDSPCNRLELTVAHPSLFDGENCNSSSNSQMVTQLNTVLDLKNTFIGRKNLRSFFLPMNYIALLYNYTNQTFVVYDALSEGGSMDDTTRGTVLWSALDGSNTFEEPLDKADAIEFRVQGGSSKEDQLAFQKALSCMNLTFTLQPGYEPPTANVPNVTCDTHMQTLCQKNRYELPFCSCVYSLKQGGVDEMFTRSQRISFSLTNQCNNLLCDQKFVPLTYIPSDLVFQKAVSPCACETLKQKVYTTEDTDLPAALTCEGQVLRGSVDQLIPQEREVIHKIPPWKLHIIILSVIFVCFMMIMTYTKMRPFRKPQYQKSVFPK